MSGIKSVQEWLKQAEYDLGAAEVMLYSGRMIYCVFMCHLSVEKALKAAWVQKFSENPPKTHSLSFLEEKTAVIMSEEHKDFIERLDEVSVPTRYPDELDALFKVYDADRVKDIFCKTGAVIACLNDSLKK